MQGESTFAKGGLKEDKAVAHPGESRSWLGDFNESSSLWTLEAEVLSGNTQIYPSSAAVSSLAFCKLTLIPALTS